MIAITETILNFFLSNPYYTGIVESLHGEIAFFVNGKYYDNEQDYRIALRKLKIERILKQLEQK